MCRLKIIIDDESYEESGQLGYRGSRQTGFSGSAQVGSGGSGQAGLTGSVQVGFGGSGQAGSGAEFSSGGSFVVRSSSKVHLHNNQTMLSMSMTVSLLHLSAYCSDI